MGWDNVMRRAAGESGPRCGLCEAAPGVPEINLPREHAPGCPAGRPVAERIEEEKRALREQAAAVRRELVQAGHLPVHVPLAVSQRRADIQRGALAAARLIRDHGRTLAVHVDAHAFAEALAQKIEHHFSEVEIERRVNEAIDRALLDGIGVRVATEGSG